MSSKQQLQFDTVESPFGPKLAVQFPYDKQTVAAIKRLSWSRTHRSYNDPSDDDAVVGYRCWTVDHTEDALEALEHHLDTAVPNEYWPGGSSGTRSGGAGVQLVVPAGSGHFRVETDASRVLSLLDSAFSYRIEDAEYTDAYQNGDWDGREHLFSKRYRRAPVGLLDQARSLIEREGYEVSVIREAPNTGRDIDTAWAFDHDLRPYQRETVQAMLDNGGGIVSLPTGTGKTVVGLRFINALDSRSLVLVHSRELLYQWADRIRSTLDVEPGIIGDGEFSQGPVTVATLQTLLARGGSGAPDDLADDYGIVLFDECHKTSAAEQMHDLGTDISARYRVGLSATPWRRVDGEALKIEAAVGSVAHEVPAKQMIRQGYLANPTFEVVDPQEYGKPRRASPGESYQEAKTRVIEADPTRITAIATRTLELANSGQQVLVNVNRRGHAKLIASVLSEDVTENDVVAGIDNPDRERQLRDTYSKLARLTDTDATVLTDSKRKPTTLVVGPSDRLCRGPPRTTETARLRLSGVVLEANSSAEIKPRVGRGPLHSPAAPYGSVWCKEAEPSWKSRRYPARAERPSAGRSSDQSKQPLRHLSRVGRARPTRQGDGTSGVGAAERAAASPVVGPIRRSPERAAGAPQADTVSRWETGTIPDPSFRGPTWSARTRPVPLTDRRPRGRREGTGGGEQTALGRAGTASPTPSGGIPRLESWEDVNGNTANSEREQVLDDLESGDQGIVISTILKEGVDIPALDAVVLAHGRRSDIETIQTIGRVLRPSGGAEARVVDVADSGRFFGAAYRDRQKTVKDYYELDQPPRAGTPQRAVE